MFFVIESGVLTVDDGSDSYKAALLLQSEHAASMGMNHGLFLLRMCGEACSETPASVTFRVALIVVTEDVQCKTCLLLLLLLGLLRHCG